MNERIQELEVEAIAYADSKVPAMDRYNDIYHSIVRGKFAELIVLDCMKLVEDYTIQETWSREPYSWYANNTIRKHFGIEV